MDELELFKEFIFKKYGVKLMQYQIEFSKQILGLNGDRIFILSRRNGRDFLLKSIIEFKLSLKQCGVNSPIKQMEDKLWQN